MRTIKLLGIALSISAVSFGQTGNEVQGEGAGQNLTTGDFDTFFGDSAGASVTTGQYNTMIGYRAGMQYHGGNIQNFTGSDNTYIGAEAVGGINPTGSSGSTDNTIIGKRAGYHHLGTDVVFIGTHAGYNNNNGADNTFIGEEAGFSNTEGDDNTFVGEDAGYNNTTASDNTFIGSRAGRSNTTGRQNTFVGNEAGQDNTTGFWNTSLGDSAGVDCGVGFMNTFLGHAAGSATEHADHNTFVGSYAGGDNNRTNNTTNANRNTYLGAGTGYTNRSGSDNVGIGAGADFGGTDLSRCVFIGSNGFVHSGYDGSNAMVNANDVIAIGYEVFNNGEFSVGIGNLLDQHGTHAVGMGYDSNIEAAGDYSVLIGSQAFTDQAYTVGLGHGSSITASNGIGLGSNVTVSGDSAMAIGSDAITSGAFSTAIGFGTNVSGSYSMALGTNAATAVNNSLVVGGLSPTDRMTLGIGTSSPNQLASIDLSETDHGFLVSRMTAAQQTSFEAGLGTTEEGMMIYNTDTDQLLIWDGAQWNGTGGVDSDDQTLSLSGTSLTIEDGNAVDLSAIDTDTQLTEAEVDAFVANNGYLTSFTEVDGDPTNEIQDISLSGTDLSISSGSTIDLSSIDTDTQLTEAEVDAFAANNGYLTSFTEVDGDPTNEIQDITLSGTDLSISSGSTIDLSAIDTDTQLTEAEVDAFVANNGYLTSFTEVDGDPTNEIQDIALSGTDLSISSGSTIDLSAIDTDDQTLSLTGTDLTITNGNTVDLSALQDGTGTDSQNLTSATLSGTTLQIDIENGTSVSVDLALLLADLENRVTTIEGCACDSTLAFNGAGGDNPEQAILYQNIPNPFNGTSSIKYYIPSWANSANLVISNSFGQLVSTIDIHEVGDYGTAHLNAEGLASGTYYYTLYINQTLIDTKKMIVE